MHTTGWTTGDAHMHVRGGESPRSEKKNYSVELYLILIENGVGCWLLADQLCWESRPPPFLPVPTLHPESKSCGSCYTTGRSG